MSLGRPSRHLSDQLAKSDPRRFAAGFPLSLARGPRARAAPLFHAARIHHHSWPLCKVSTPRKAYGKNDFSARTVTLPKNRAPNYGLRYASQLWLPPG